MYICSGGRYSYVIVRLYLRALHGGESLYTENLYSRIYGANYLSNLSLARTSTEAGLGCLYPSGVACIV
jgi:hypothetical protein